MAPLLLLVIYALSATLAAAAAIQQPALLSNTLTDPFPILNISAPNGQVLQPGKSSLRGEDPRFFCLMKEGKYDLPDKSVLMNALKLLEELSKYPFDNHFHGGEWSTPGYEDVRIDIPPQVRLKVSFAMWGVARAVAHMNIKGYTSLQLSMFYNGGRGVGVVEVGTIYFVETRRVQRTAGPTPETLSLTAPLPTNITYLDSSTIISGYSISTLGAPNYNLKILLEGARLSRYGCFASIFAGINEAASWDRSQPLDGSAEVVGGDTVNVGLRFRPWNLPAAPPYLEYTPLIWMLAHVPRYMIRTNRFQAGEFILEIDGQPVGRGEVFRTR